jgi:hypothetical protein
MNAAQLSANDNELPPPYDPSADRRDELRKQGADLPPRTAKEEIAFQAARATRKR